VKINIPAEGGHDEELEIPRPKAANVYIPADNRYEEVTYFGYKEGSRKLWTNKYEEVIKKICDGHRTRFGSGSQELKHIDTIESIYMKWIKYLFRSDKPQDKEDLSIGGMEKEYFNFLRDTAEDDLRSKVPSFESDIRDALPRRVRFKHTYYILAPVKFDEKGKIQAKLSQFLDHPTDPRGMPWECDSNGRLMVWNWRDDRNIRLTRAQVREKVPDFEFPTLRSGTEADLEQFKQLCDILDVANWVVNEWDAYRDDLRDGRYHPDSMTVHDYLTANHEAAGGEWELANERDHAAMVARRRYVMSLPRTSLAVNPQQIEGTRQPSNISPAFDLRVFEPMSRGIIGFPIKDWEHVGRVFYYDDSTGIFTHLQHDPMASTRGTAMFIIDKFLSEGMVYDEVHEDLKEIGSQMGFDYGPRDVLGPLCKDPFEIDIAAANASMAPKKKS